MPSKRVLARNTHGKTQQLSQARTALKRSTLGSSQPIILPSHKTLCMTLQCWERTRVKRVRHSSTRGSKKRKKSLRNHIRGNSLPSRSLNQISLTRGSNQQLHHSSQIIISSQQLHLRPQIHGRIQPQAQLEGQINHPRFTKSTMKKTTIPSWVQDQTSVAFEPQVWPVETA